MVMRSLEWVNSSPKTIGAGFPGVWSGTDHQVNSVLICNIPSDPKSFCVVIN